MKFRTHSFLFPFVPMQHAYIRVRLVSSYFLSVVANCTYSIIRYAKEKANGVRKENKSNTVLFTIFAVAFLHAFHLCSPGA